MSTTRCEKVRKLDDLLIDARDDQVLLTHSPRGSDVILCLKRSDFESLTGRQIVKKFNAYIDLLVEGTENFSPAVVSDIQPKWSRMSCYGMPDKPQPKKAKVFKEVQTTQPKSIWLRSKSNDQDERETSLEAISRMSLALEAIIEELHQRTLPPPPPPPPPPAPPKPECFELPFGIARKRWRRREQVPRSTEEFATFFRSCGVTILEITPGSVNVPKSQASKINRILTGQSIPGR